MKNCHNFNSQKQLIMKRSEHIVVLSKDHHFGLLCSWKIEQGFFKNIALERIASYVEYVWNNHLSEHFKHEETIIFPYSNETYNQQIKTEHQELKVLAQKIAQHPEKSIVEKFAHLLKNHIRFEEREWFPYLQENLDESDLKQIGKRLENSHTKPFDNFEDEFWK